MTSGQKAYEAYRKSRLGVSHDGNPLPEDCINPAAWQAFADAISQGLSVDMAYNRYLDKMKGLTVSGGIAPSWAYLTNQKPELAFAWSDAANALS